MFVVKASSAQQSYQSAKASSGVDFANISSSITDRKNKDTLSISSQMQAFLSSIDSADKEKIDAQIKDSQNLIAQNNAMLERLKEQSKQENDAFKDLSKCIIIAMRIINGDYVPQKDDKFLAETEPEMYLKAKMLRRKNDDPKDYKTLLEAEKDEKISDSFGSATEKAPVEQIKAIPNDDIVFED